VHLGLELEAVFVKRHQRARSRSDPVQAPLNALGRVIPFTAPGVVLSVVGGLYERVAIRHVDCVGGMAAGSTGAETGGGPMKTRRRKTTKVKRGKVPTAARRRGSSTANLKKQLDQRTRELHEALEQQAATSDVLGVISSSPGDLQPVFDVMLANAVRVCEAQLGILWRREGDGFRPAAMHGVPPNLIGVVPALWRPSPESMLAQMERTREVAQVVDARLTPAYLSGEAWPVAVTELLGERSFLVVPMLGEDELVGALQIFRQEVRPFSAKHVALVENFAKQAVIAIEIFSMPSPPRNSCYNVCMYGAGEAMIGKRKVTSLTILSARFEAILR
jgi:hypothetical protein